jgi:hypothetical protein
LALPRCDRCGQLLWRPKTTFWRVITIGSACRLFEGCLIPSNWYAVPKRAASRGRGVLFLSRAPFFIGGPAGFWFAPGEVAVTPSWEPPNHPPRRRRRGRCARICPVSSHHRTTSAEAGSSWLVNEQTIAPYIPVIDKSKRDDGTFSREDFTFDRERDIYICPAGKILTTTRKVMNDDQLLYRASKLDCDVCPLKMQCCPKEPAGKIPCSIYERLAT